MKVVIIGGSHAGTTAARTLKKINQNIEVILLEKREYLGSVPSNLNFLFENLLHEDTNLFKGIVLPEVLMNMGIDLRLKTEVTKINVVTKTIEVKNESKNYKLSFDRLILAMGSEKFLISEPILNTSVSDLITYKMPAEILKAHRVLKNSKHITIIGSGLIGLELASSLSHHLDKKITIIEQMSRPLFRYFDTTITDVLMKYKPGNIQFLFNKTLKSTQRMQKKIKVTTFGEESFLTDSAVLALNPRPNITIIPKEIYLDADNSILVNDHMQTNCPDIYAIGDLVKIPFGPEIDRAYLPLISMAHRTARIAAFHITKHNITISKPSQRTIATKIFNLFLASCGITYEESILLGIAVTEVTKTFNYYSPIYPKTDFLLKIKIIYDTTSHVLLGAQLITTEEKLVSLINIFTQFTADKKKIENLVNNEYYYAPLLSADQNFINEIFLEAVAHAK
ncbi:FAD-dependent oxidoreductase [Enterococcus sp. SMC-9]|uniref:FAD-dependent oxidoreductase n=1 Tax=Enterococcus sp. SMC-9 TaxID=2862343 RepID=UPI001E42E352|nr:FAD-dependent oxidoreductase [Enterococcus sp. SMC-9]MCD1025007.1 FAD-dependent oxidoreductase [Enterococcus sp. SMC-9]